MVVVSLPSHAEIGRNDYRKNASHFIWYVIRHRWYESFLGDSDEEYQMFWSFCDEKFCYEEGEIDYEKQAKTARINKMKASEVKFFNQRHHKILLLERFLLSLLFKR